MKKAGERPTEGYVDLSGLPSVVLDELNFQATQVQRIVRGHLGRMRLLDLLEEMFLEKKIRRLKKKLGKNAVYRHEEEVVMGRGRADSGASAKPVRQLSFKENSVNASNASYSNTPRDPEPSYTPEHRRNLELNAIEAAAYVGSSVLSIAKSLFSEMDRTGKGEVYDKDVDPLFVKLWKECDRTLPRGYGDMLAQAIENTVVIHDRNGKSLINFQEFLSLINRDPWRETIAPTAVKDQIENDDNSSKKPQSFVRYPAFYRSWNVDLESEKHFKVIMKDMEMMRALFKVYDDDNDNILHPREFKNYVVDYYKAYTEAMKEHGMIEETEAREAVATVMLRSVDEVANSGCLPFTVAGRAFPKAGLKLADFLASLPRIAASIK